MTLVPLDVVVGRPPVYDAICSTIGVPKDGVIYTWGDTIYNPAGHVLDHPVLVHEHTHSVQQRRVGGPDAWWDRYLVDVAWRYAQELEAYRAEYQAYCAEHKDRNVRARFLATKASDLAGPLYGRLGRHAEVMAAIRA